MWLCMFATRSVLHVIASERLELLFYTVVHSFFFFFQLLFYAFTLLILFNSCKNEGE